ncbi:hypothetical protein ACFLY6_00720 [Candidatus Dependentiae bacterium]
MKVKKTILMTNLAFSIILFGTTGLLGSNLEGKKNCDVEKWFKINKEVFIKEYIEILNFHKNRMFKTKETVEHALKLAIENPRENWQKLMPTRLRRTYRDGDPRQEKYDELYGNPRIQKLANIVDWRHWRIKRDIAITDRDSHMHTLEEICKVVLESQSNQEANIRLNTFCSRYVHEEFIEILTKKLIQVVPLEMSIEDKKFEPEFRNSFLKQRFAAEKAAEVLDEVLKREPSKAHWESGEGPYVGPLAANLPMDVIIPKHSQNNWCSLL